MRGVRGTLANIYDITFSKSYSKLAKSTPCREIILTNHVIEDFQELPKAGKIVYNLCLVFMTQANCGLSWTRKGLFCLSSTTC